MERWITDWEPSSRYPVYTRANAGEVLPDPCSPLAWTLVWEQGCLQGWRDAAIHGYQAFDEADYDEERPEVVGHFGGYLYISASSARIFGVRGPGLSPEQIDYVYFGEHPDVPPYQPEPWHENAAATERMGAWIAGVVTADDLPELRADRQRADDARASRPDLTHLTDEQLVERACSFVPLLRHLFDQHLRVTAAASIGPGILAQVAAALGDPSMTMRLVSGIGEVDSAAPSQAIWELSREVRASTELTAAFADGVPGLLDRLHASDSQAAHDFLHELKRFLVRLGSRGPNEWDIRSDTWETKPELALVLVDRMRLAPDRDAPTVRNERRVTDREALTKQVTDALAGDLEQQGMFLAGLRSAHVHLQGRERTKTNVIKVLHEVRMAVHELGARHGYTPSAVCMLLADELEAFVADPTEFRARLASREQQYLALFELEPPFIVNGKVPPLEEWPRRGSTVPSAIAGEALCGVPGCPGTATGRARVVLDPADPRGLQPGDVLVAPITDPSWTPLFVPAAAVVVDVGAQVSHAVIVSRELGVPCVVSVQDATRRIPDGATITVDGDAGTVTIVSL